MPHGEPAYWSSTAKPTPRGQASAPNLKDYNAARRYPSMLDKMYFSKIPREMQLPAARPKPHNRPVVETVWRRRIRRAENLSAQHPFAGQILTFYSRRPAFSRTFTSASKLLRPAGTDLLSKGWSNADVPADPAEVIALAFLPPPAASCAPAFRSDARATLTRAAPFCSRTPGPRLGRSLAYPRSYAQRSSGTEATRTVPAEVDGFEVRATGVAAFHVYIGKLVGGINRCSLTWSLSSQPGQCGGTPPPETEPAEQVGARPHPSGAERPGPGSVISKAITFVIPRLISLCRVCKVLVNIQPGPLVT